MKFNECYAEGNYNVIEFQNFQLWMKIWYFMKWKISKHQIQILFILIHKSKNIFWNSMSTCDYWVRVAINASTLIEFKNFILLVPCELWLYITYIILMYRKRVFITSIIKFVHTFRVKIHKLNVLNSFWQ